MVPRTHVRSQLAVLVAALAAGSAPARAAGTLFLSRCTPGTCTYSPGFDDSRTNHSSLLNQTVTIPPFAHGDAAWAEHLACVRRAYAPFDVAVTDVDPGVAPHWEVVVAGLPGNIGMPPTVGGVAPFTCAVIPNGIAYSFAAVYSDMKELCWTTAQETAHLFGLDHEFEQRDPMTYIPGCLEKVFSPADAACGETEPRACTCGGTTQNSHALLTSLLGAAGPGALLFDDSFAVTGTAGAEGSTCRWDLSLGGPASLLPPGGEPPAAGLACGTDVLHPQRRR